jgi:hypothetical protein
MPAVFNVTIVLPADVFITSFFPFLLLSQLPSNQLFTNMSEIEQEKQFPMSETELENEVPMGEAVSAKAV